jgi:hypothetical protein
MLFFGTLVAGAILILYFTHKCALHTAAPTNIPFAQEENLQ